ncbi:MAG: T9SS type A sorting domain-containing protein [Bacteroidetes bacterium]|nr:T9SS type A sorting domain-containing protein [Bacteroidota bacterium]
MKKITTNLAAYLKLVKPNHLILTLFVLLMSNFTVMACDCDAPPNNIVMSSTSTHITFSGNKSYSSACGCYELQVEIKPVGQSFDGLTNIYTSNAGCIQNPGMQALNPVTVSFNDIFNSLGGSELKWRIRQQNVGWGSCWLWVNQSQNFFACSGNPSGNISASGATNFCQGASVALNAPSGSDYQWFRNNNLISGATSSTYIANLSGNYSVSTSVGGCPTTPVTVTVNDAPAATVSASDTVIEYGASATLTANISSEEVYYVPLSDLLNVPNNCGTGSWYGWNNQGFKWNDAGQGTASNVTIEFSVGVECSSTTYSTNLNGASGPNYGSAPSWCNCGAPNSAQLITININNPSNYNVGGMNIFNGNTNTGSTMGFIPASSLNNAYAKVTVTYGSGGNVNYNWTPGNLTTSEISVSPLNTTTYTLVASDNIGCSTTIPTTITVLPPPVSFTLSSTEVTCPGGNDGIITVNVTGGSGGTIEYSLDNAAYVTNNVFSGLSAGSYQVHIKDASFVLDAQTIIVEASSATEIVVNAGNDVTTYYGYTPAECATLTGSATGGTGSYGYSWSNGATTSSLTVCPSSPTAYTLTITDSNGCTGTDNVTVNAVDVACGNNAKNPKVAMCHNGNSICISPNAVPAHLNNAGSTLGSCNLAGEEILVEAGQFNLYPNPTNNKATVEFTVDYNQEVTIAIYDSKGAFVKEVFKGIAIENQTQKVEINAGDLTTGIYFVRMSNDTEVKHIKLVRTN